MDIFPTETKCGECGGRIKLQNHLWDEFATDCGHVVGFTQQADCYRCNSTVVCVIGRGPLLLAADNRILNPKH